jgi:murein DD-endopeptidase MepM/ murein hydrolase activator NlpD
MKRQLTIVAVATLVIGVSVPAAAFPTTLQPPTATQPKGTPQVFAASGAALAPVVRDTYTVEKLVQQVAVAAATFTGSLAMWPANAPVNDGFGYRDGGEFHKGIDIMAPGGSAIVAASPGVVTKVSYEAGWGQYVEIDHGGGVSTLYAHMIEGSPGVSVGQGVSAGDFLGLVGSTGYATVNHLHFEVHVFGSPVDPMGWLP